MDKLEFKVESRITEVEKESGCYVLKIDGSINMRLVRAFESKFKCILADIYGKSDSNGLILLFDLK